MATDTVSEPTAADENAGGIVAVRWLPVLLAGLILVILSNLWVRQGALLTISAQVAMAVPPIPAFGALLVLLVALPVVRRIGLGRRQVIALYCFLTLAVALTSGGAMRFFLPSIPVFRYFSNPENSWAQLHQHIPDWMAPTGPSVIRHYFEGAPSGQVPWDAWIGPLAIWMVFFVAFFGLLICISLVFRPVWEESEHLAYPLAEVPLLLGGFREDELSVWRNRLFWIGFGLAALYNILNIAHAFNPGVAALGTDASLDALVAEWPLSTLRPLRVSYRPEILGFGYLMPTEIALSTVFFYFVYMKGISLGAAFMGIQNAQLPYRDPQAAGALIALIILLVYGARGRILEVFTSLRGGSRSVRMLAVGLAVTTAVVIGFWLIAGMELWLIVLYFGLVLAFAIGYARIRAETGYPRMWVRPLGGERNVIINALGSEPLTAGGMRSATLLASSFYFARGYMGQLMAYPVEALHVATEARISRRQMAGLMFAAVIIGIAVSWWMHLDSYYQYGANTLAGGTTAGGFRIHLMRSSYDRLAGWMTSPEAPNTSESLATLAGFAVTAGLMGIRRIFLRFPLHPLGLILALTGGGYTGWAMLLLVSLVKIAVYRLGGMRLYRQLIPAFIGIAIGHYFAAGLVWSLLASFGPSMLSQRYQLWF